MKKRIFLSIGLCFLTSLLLASVVSAAPAPKVDVCHLDDMGNYILINISENAFQAHLDHGDKGPGDAFPGMPGYVFAHDCSAMANVEGVWEGMSGAADNISFNFVMTLYQDSYGSVSGTIFYPFYNGGTLRYVTGEVIGNVFLFRTHTNELDPDIPYWADCKGSVSPYHPCTVIPNGNFFDGFGWDSNNVHVGFWAFRQ